MRLAILIITVFLGFGPGFGSVSSAAAEPMTTERLEVLIERVGDGVERVEGAEMWRFEVEGAPVTVIADPKNDRMRILVPVVRAAELPPSVLMRLLQANFDSALDARYAVAQGVLWSAFIHPLAPLEEVQFLNGLGQTVNLARGFGTSFSSGGLTFGGGDSQELQKRELIERLLRKGQPT